MTPIESRPVKSCSRGRSNAKTVPSGTYAPSAIFCDRRALNQETPPTTAQKTASAMKSVTLRESIVRIYDVEGNFLVVSGVVLGTGYPCAGRNLLANRQSSLRVQEGVPSLTGSPVRARYPPRRPSP